MEEERQHAIPQQISSYQFRLVGDMTLQQFFQVAGGAVVALLIYSSGLPGYIKWPLVLISFLTGVAFAFFPIEDRPLQKWVILFFQSIYSPTLFVWRADRNVPDHFQKEDVSLPQQEAQQQQPPKPSTPPATSDPSAAPLPELEKKEQQILSQIDKSLEQQPVVITQDQPEKEEPEPKKKLEIPQTEDIEVEKKDHQKDMQAVQQTEQQDATTEPDISPMAVQPSKGKTKQAQFNQDAGPPTPPSKPNVVVGQVLGPEGEIVENAILEIKDSEGRPVRALKSNKLGHFMIVTPLSDGEYEIITEKEGLEFDNIKFRATGKQIQPIAIWANKSGKSEQGKKEDQEPEQKKEAEQTQPKQEESKTEKTIYSQQ